MGKLVTQKTGDYVLQKVTIPAGTHTFSVTQRDQRNFHRKHPYTYSYCRSVLMKLENGKDLSEGVEFIGSHTGNRVRDANLEVTVEAGTYAFFVQMDWEGKSEKFVDSEYAVARYGPGEAEWKDCASNSKEEVLTAAFTSHAKSG